MVSPRNLETLVSQRQNFQNPVLVLVSWKQRTNSRCIRCDQAGRNAGSDFCCERPEETRRARRKRKKHTCFSNTTEAGVANVAVDDSMVITVSLLGGVAEKKNVW